MFEDLKDIYGRQLPTPSWVDKPSECGYYFYAANRKDWDLARLIGVQSVEYNQDGKWIRKFEAAINGDVVNVQTLPDEVRWFGPIRMAKPDWS